MEADVYTKLDEDAGKKTIYKMARQRNEYSKDVKGGTFILEWTTSLDTSSSTLFVCRGLCPAGLSPTSGHTGISARRRYQFWERDLSPTFKRISDRICAASINLVNHKLIVMSAYAPTLEVREANPELRELFYNLP